MHNKLNKTLFAVILQRSTYKQGRYVECKEVTLSICKVISAGNIHIRRQEFKRNDTKKSDLQ